LDEKDVNSIQKAKEMFNNPHLKADLALISSNYSFLSKIYYTFGKTKHDAIRVYFRRKNVKEKLKNPQGDKGKAIYNKITVKK